MSENKKAFFREPTAAQIKEYSSVRDIYRDLIYNILDTNEDNAAIIRTRLVPESYDGPRKFSKHGPEVKPRRYTSLEHALSQRRTPVQLREQAFNHVSAQPHCGYTVKPFIGTDKTTRRFFLVEEVEGTKIYAYANQSKPRGFVPKIYVKPYPDVGGVEKDGAEVDVKVPSRRQRKLRYEFKLLSVPIIDNDNKWGIANSINTEGHSCGSKRYFIRYTGKRERERSKIVPFCAHEVAAYLSAIDHIWHKHKSMVPLEMSQYAIPTQLTVDFYEKLIHNVLIQTPDEDQPRKLNKAEKEILLWGLVSKLGHDPTFFATEKVRDYRWRN